jgi:hypothetical protein
MGRGSVFVMTKSTNGAWSQTAKLVPSPQLRNRTCLNQSCQFGYSVALSGDGNTAIIGTPWANYSAAFNRSPGKVWVFRRGINGSWTQEAAITPDTSMGRALFGYSVGVANNGKTAVIGGIGYNQWIGAAWIYRRGSDSAWTSSTILNGIGNTAGANIGSSVAISGDGSVAVVGASAYGDSGAAYIFSSADNSTWTLDGQLIALDAEPFKYGVYEPKQGVSVSVADVDGAHAVAVGGVDTDTLDTGAAWVWNYNSLQRKYLSTKLPKGGVYQRPQGRRVAISGDGRTVLSANGKTSSLYVYRKNE